MCVCGCGTGWDYDVAEAQADAGPGIEVVDPRDLKRCGDCGGPKPDAERIGCGLMFPPTKCFYCGTLGVDWLSGRCSNEKCSGSADRDYNPRAEPIWDPLRCPKASCNGFLRYKDFRDWGLAAPPEDPPPWALYWISVAGSLGRQAGGMGAPGVILETEAKAAISSFPAWQEPWIRRIFFEVEAGRAEAENETAVRDAQERENSGSAGKG